MKAKASVQYNDFKGTSAADISDHTNLVEFLRSKGVNTDKYKPIGAAFYQGYSTFSSASFICEDTENSKLIRLYMRDVSQVEFFDLFKRLDVVFADRDISECDIEERRIEDL